VRKFLRTCKGETTEGSLDWFLKTERYTKWLNGDSNLLWVYGGSGKGKSMIALHVLDVLERAEGEPIWHFYDTQASVAHATGGNMIRSLIYQLLRIYDNLFQYILPELNIQCEALFDDSMFETQWSILDSMLHHPTLPILNCILDGIDECEPTSLEWLLTKIDRLFLWTASGDIFTSRDRYGLMGAMGSPLSEKPRPRLRMLILSRAKSPPCLSILSRYKHLSLDEYWKDCEGGVARLIELSFKQAKVDVRLTGRYELRHTLGQLDQYLVKELVNRAEGSYLWVNLNTSTLKDLITKLQSFDDIVESLPAKLEDIYVRMLHGIAPQSTGSQVKAAYVLQWVLAAARPLKVEESMIRISTTMPRLTFRLGSLCATTSWRFTTTVWFCVTLRSATSSISFALRTRTGFLQHYVFVAKSTKSMKPS
jgi:hypothetical protein